MRRAAALATIVALALSPTAALAATAKTTLHTIEQQVMCVTCNIPLEVAESPAADAERDYIRHLVDSGLSVAQIKAKLVVEYGDAVLDVPPNHGFNTVFYILPIAGGVAAVALLAILLPRWRRRNPPQTAAAGPALTPADKERLEADMATFDA